MLLTDYLTPPPDDDETKYRVKVTIEKIDDNPYYRDIGGVVVTHFGLFVSIETQCLLDEHKGLWSEWEENYDQLAAYYPDRIRFTYSGFCKPTLEQFTEHIKHQLECVFFTLCDPDSCSHIDAKSGSRPWVERRDITPEMIWVYTRLQNKLYSKTVDFIKDFDYWSACLYDTQKWYYDERISDLMDTYNNPLVDMANYPKDRIEKIMSEIA